MGTSRAGEEEEEEEEEGEEEEEAAPAQATSQGPGPAGPGAKAGSPAPRLLEASPTEGGVSQIYKEGGREGRGVHDGSTRPHTDPRLTGGERQLEGEGELWGAVKE